MKIRTGSSNLRTRSLDFPSSSSARRAILRKPSLISPFVKSRRSDARRLAISGLSALARSHAAATATSATATASLEPKKNILFLNLPTLIRFDLGNQHVHMLGKQDAYRQVPPEVTLSPCESCL